MEKIIPRKTNMIVSHVRKFVDFGYHLRDFVVSLPEARTRVLFHPMLGAKS
jgi:hypothetical protein